MIRYLWLHARILAMRMWLCVPRPVRRLTRAVGPFDAVLLLAAPLAVGFLLGAAALSGPARSPVDDWPAPVHQVPAPTTQGVAP